MVTPALVVGLGPIDRVVGGGCRKLRGRHVVVDAPPRVGIERLAALRPPGVWTFNLARGLPPDVDPPEPWRDGAVNALNRGARGAEEPVEIGTLLQEESRVLAVALPVLDVELAVPDVEVTHDHSEVGVGRQLGHPDRHGVEEFVLLDLFRGVDHARVHVGADDRHDAPADLVVGLEPATGAVEIVSAELDPVRLRAGSGCQRHPRAALCRRRVVQDAPLGTEQPLKVFGGGADLLHGENVDAAGVEPVAHSFAIRSAHAIGVHGRYA